MRALLTLGLTAALLAGCATNDPEPTSSPSTDTVDEAAQEPQAGEQPSEEDGDDAAHNTDQGESDAAEDTASDAASADEPADDASDGAVAVEIGDFFFEGDRTSIEVGDTVTWTHQGDVTHNVTSRDDSFASDNLSPGDTFMHTFDAAGSFEYVCTLHGQMVATVDVG